MTLVEFLLARIAEDESVARPLTDTTPDEDGIQPRWAWSVVDWNSDAADAHGSRWSPARVLAECEAKRRIVEQESGRRTVRDTVASWTNWDGSVSVRLPSGEEQTLTEQEFHDQHTLPYASSTLRLLALPFADHPDYDESWRA